MSDIPRFIQHVRDEYKFDIKFDHGMIWELTGDLNRTETHQQYAPHWKTVDDTWNILEASWKLADGASRKLT